MSETTQVEESYVAHLEERLAALEFALESPEWRLLTAQSDVEFSRQGLRAITELARIMYLKQPLIKRGVSVKRFYVWGQGWTVRAGEEDIQTCLDEFLYGQKNDDSIGGHEARMQLEVELETDGNLFFVFFPNRLTGRVRVRTIPFSQVEDVISNPDDAREPWYYRRIWTEQSFSAETGLVAGGMRTAYYPDWRYDPVSKPTTIGGYPVLWDSPIYHVRIGGFSDWKFGISEVYDAIDWAKAYKDNLEDWASIVRAYRRFAFQLSTPGGSRAVAAAKAKLSTTMGAVGGERNPPPVTGSTFIGSEGATLQPIATGGATVSPEDGRRLLLMVAASSGLPETFYGDASIGSLATAKSLDRPTELMMEDRQQLWRDVFLNIFEFVTRWAVKAPQGMLSSMASVTREVDDGQYSENVGWDESVDASISVDFPPLVQHDIPALVGSIVQAATLGGAGTLAGTIDLVTLSRLLLTALGATDADEILERMFPDGEIPEESESQAEERPQAESLMIDAVKEMRNAIARLVESN